MGRADQVECRRGHSLTDPANVRIGRRGDGMRRTCLTCERLRQSERTRAARSGERRTTAPPRGPIAPEDAIRPGDREAAVLATAMSLLDAPVPCSGIDMIGPRVDPALTAVCDACPVTAACEAYGRACGLGGIWGGVLLRGK